MTSRLITGSKEVIMAIPVWGQWHTDMLLDICLPSMLFPENIPAFAKLHNCTIHIYTREKELEKIENSKSVQELKRFVRVNIDTSVLERVEGTNPVNHYLGWNHATELAIACDGYVWNMLPDVVFADGALRYLAQRLHEGYYSLMWFYPRVTSNTFVPAAIKAIREAPDGAISPREMVKLSLLHFHPTMAAYFIDSPHFPKHAELLMRAVKGQGIAARMMINVNNIFDPQKFLLSEQNLTVGKFDPSTIHFVTDSDDLFAVSLAPLGKDSIWYRHAGPQRNMETALWWLQFDGSANDFIASQHIRLHTNDIDERDWIPVERVLDLRIRKVAVLREAFRLLTYFEDLALPGMATLLSLLIASGVLIKLIGKYDRFLILVPKSLDLDTIQDRFSNVSNVHSNFDLLRRHLVPLPDDVDVLNIEDIVQTRLSLLSGENLMVTYTKDVRLTINGILAETEVRHLFNQRLIFLEGEIPESGQAFDAS